MIKIIETNILYKEDNTTISDVQSRIIEVDNWDGYIEEIKNRRQINRHSIIGWAYGVSFPKFAFIKKLDINNKRLICDLRLYNNNKILKTAYICK